MNRLLKKIMVLGLAVSTTVILMGCNNNVSAKTVNKSTVENEFERIDIGIKEQSAAVIPEGAEVPSQSESELTEEVWAIQFSKDPFVKPLKEMLDAPMTPQDNAMGGNFRAYPYVSPNGFAYQVISMQKGELVIEIGNTGSKTFTVDTNNLAFAVYTLAADSKNISGSYIEGGAVTIQPGEVKRIVLKSPHEHAVNVDVTINGDNVAIHCGSEGNDDVLDTEPYSGSLEAGNVFNSNGVNYPAIYFKGKLTGTENFKAVSNGIKMIENKTFAGLPELTKNGSYALVHLKLANTSNETLTISRLNASSFNPDTDDVRFYPILGEALNTLGEDAFPTEIAPNTIVEGYVPILLEGNDFNHGFAIAFEKDSDILYVDDLEQLRVME